MDTQIGVKRLLGKSRRKYSREFKLEAVKQVVEQGRSVASVADGLGVHPSLLQRWKSQLADDGAFAFPANGRPSATDEENRRPRKVLGFRCPADVALTG